MAKALLVLMLTVSQVLAGTSGAQYLCFKADGSFCCIDNGGANCICCPKEELKAEAVVEKVHSCGCDQGNEHESGEPKSRVELPEVCGSELSDNSGCSHVPVVDGAMVATAKRSAFAVEVRRDRDLTTIPMHLVVHSNEFRISYLSHCSLAHGSRTVIDLAWVSMRC